ncbi:MAG: cytochrome c nitrite reductase small subunit [Pseudomonadota bacterium]
MATALRGRGAARALIVALVVMTGIALGLGTTTFVYAEGASYLVDSPKACANCHVMNEQFEGWQASSHHGVATCNDCHAPHDDVVGKLWVKATNGFWHSFYFTTGTFHDPIRITPRNRAVTQGACRSCHGAIVENIDAHPFGEELDCIGCHRSVGHLH